MKAALIYFSGTGNTEYVMRKFKNELEKNNIDCHMIDTTAGDVSLYGYNFYVFGFPIHADMIPDYFIDWIKRNIKNKVNRRCIVFSTQASNKGAGADYLSRLLENMGFNISIKDFIKMPNNYYVVMSSKSSKKEIEEIKESVSKKVEMLINKFIKGEKYIKRVSKGRMILANGVYKLFSLYSKKWAKNNLSVDFKVCIKCGRCVKQCPTKNIEMIEDKIVFRSKCISCQRCLHKCPVNAFRYRNKEFEQYKL